MFGFIGMSDLIAMLPLLLYVGYLGIPLYCIVKFYKMLSSINDNLAGIRQEAERIGTNTP